MVVQRARSIGSISAFFESFDPEEVYVDRPGDPLRALIPGEMFILIEMSGGWKVDLVVRKHRPFSEVEFARRVLVEVLDRTTG